MSTLLLSGWTQPIDALSSLAEDAVLFDYSDYATPEDAIAALREERYTAYEHCIGWSMGGQLAVQALAAGAIAPKHLTLIATSYKFVSDVPEVKAMDALTFTRFRDNYATDPVRTSGRFLALTAKGERDFKRVMGGLSLHPEVENTARWLPWLDRLGTHSMKDTVLASAPPTLIIHGMNDAIVPFAQSGYLAQLFSNAHVSGWAEVGHAPHVHDAARLVAEIAAHRAAHGVA